MALCVARLLWLAALCVALQLGECAKVHYTTGPFGFGPYNNLPPIYVPGRTCGISAYDVAWDKQMGPFNDSSYNPGLKPVTEVRTRWAASIQTVWGDIVGPDHGFADNTRQDILRLEPGEVIVKVALRAQVVGFISNLTFYTNGSRKPWVPDWRVPNLDNEQLQVAKPPEPQDWNGDPIAASWYLAYIHADILGYCRLKEAGTSRANGPGYYFTPILYFVWAADTIPPAPSPLPPPTPAPPPPPKKKSGVKVAVIAGVVGAGVLLLILAAIAWVCIRHGHSNLAKNPFMTTFSGTVGGRGAAAAAPAGGAGAGGSIPKDVETPVAGTAAAGIAAELPVSGIATARDLSASPPVTHAYGYPSYAAAYHPTYPSTHSQPPPATPHPSYPSNHGAAPPLAQPSVLESRPSTATSLPPSVSEQPLIGSGGAAFSSPAGSLQGGASTVVRSKQRSAVALPPPSGLTAPGAMMAQGGGTTAVGPLAAVGAAGVAVMGTVLLAREILDAGDRVVANHARCLRLTSRIHSILPLLNCLHTHLEKEAQAKHDQGYADLQHLTNNMNAVFSDVRDCINRWCSNEAAARRGVLVQVLRNMMVSKRFEDEFLDLNERLSGCYQDLILALNIKRTVGDNDPLRLKQQHEEDLAADLKGVAEELTTAEGEEAWNSLPPEDRANVREAFHKYGLNFNAVMTQVRKNAIGERVRDLIIPWNDINVIYEIGSGGYGTVYRGIWQDIEVAVKKLQLMVVTERAKRELSHEAYVMSLLRHPNVATSYGMVLEPPHCALVMKYYEKGTLLQLLHDDVQPLPLRRKLQLATDVAKGMAYLHNRPTDPVIHGDLKPSNLLLDDTGRVVISDFGLSRVSTLTLTTRPSSSGMSVTYTAPEILADPTGKRSAAADVYAYGLVLFEIFTRELPFESAADVMAVVQYVLGGGRPRVAGKEFEELRVPKEVVELMQQCWQQVPQARPSFSAIVGMLKEINVD